MIRKAMLSFVLAVAATPASSDCVVRHAFDRADDGGKASVKIFVGQPDAASGTQPMFFVSSLNVNTDGTSRSYNVHDPRATALAINDIRNAMLAPRHIADFEAIAAANWPLPRTWHILGSDVIEKDRRTGKPCVDAKGYMVSMTSDVAVDGGSGRVGDCDQTKWIDALVVPALVLPRADAHQRTEFDTAGALTRSPVVAMTLDAANRLAFGIVGDHGPPKELGEASVAMNRDLNGLPEDAVPSGNHDAVVRFQAPRSIVMIFAGKSARLSRPITAASVRGRVQAMFTAWGGKARLDECVAAIARL